MGLARITTPIQWFREHYLMQRTGNFPARNAEFCTRNGGYPHAFGGGLGLVVDVLLILLAVGEFRGRR